MGPHQHDNLAICEAIAAQPAREPEHNLCFAYADRDNRAKCPGCGWEGIQRFSWNAVEADAWEHTNAFWLAPQRQAASAEGRAAA